MVKTKRALSFLVVMIGFIGFSFISYAQDEVENILDNGGFENGIVMPWTTYGDATIEVVEELKNANIDEDPIEGDFCLHATVTKKGVNFWDSGLQHKPHVFEKGKKYTLAASLKSTEGNVQINFKPELSVDPWTAYSAQSFTMAEEWQDYHTTTPTMAAKVDPASITFHIGYDKCEFYVDAVRFYEGDYVQPDFVEEEAVQPQGKPATVWAQIKTN